MDKDIKLKIAPPWITYVNQIKVMFGNDPDITIEYSNEDLEIKLYVDKSVKASALQRLLPNSKIFGNIVLDITIIPANTIFSELNNLTNAELFDLAFERNPIYAYSKSIDSIFSNVITYVVFKNRVVQFFNDNLNDIHGNISTLYEDIARDIFADIDLFGICYCTDIEEKVGMPLGEWP